MLNRQACSSADPCVKYGDKISGCMSNLKSVGIGSHKLAPEAADAFMKMLEDMPSSAKTSMNLTDTYRPAKVQCNIFDFDKFERTGKGIKKGTSSVAAARPGTSNHGWGRAIDISPENVQKWIKKNGSKYGWCWGEAEGEPWHFTFCGPGKNRSKVCDKICKGDMDPSLEKPSGDSAKTEDPTTSSTSGSSELTPSSGTGTLTDFFKNMYKSLKSSGLGQKEIGEINEEVNRITDIMKKIL